MNVVGDFQRAQKTLLPDDDSVIKKTSKDYEVTALFTSGVVASIADSADSRENTVSKSGEQFSDTQSSRRHVHTVVGRATRLTLEKPGGRTEEFSVFANKLENPLKDIVTGEVLSLCVWNEAEGGAESRPQVLRIYRHNFGEERNFTPAERPVFMAEAKLFNSLKKHVIARPFYITIIALLIYGAAVFFNLSPGALEQFWFSTLVFIAPAYSFTMELLLFSGLCDPSYCQPGSAPESLGGFLFIYGIVMMIGVVTGLLKSGRVKKRNRAKNRLFNETLKEATNEAEQRLSRYTKAKKEYKQCSAPSANSPDSTNTDRITLEGAAPNTEDKAPVKPVNSLQETVDYGVESPDQERRFKFRIIRRTLFFKDIINRIEGFETQRSIDHVETKSKVMYNLLDQRTYTHTDSYSFDMPTYARKLHGLTQEGDLDSVILPGGFGAGPVKEGDVVTIYTLDLYEGQETKPYGAVALTNDTQGWDVRPGALLAIADALMKKEQKILTWIGAMLALVAIVGMLLGFIDPRLGTAGLALFIADIAGALWLKKRREHRQERFALAMEKRLCEVMGD